MTIVKLGDEAGRLAALRRYRVLDTKAEGGFDSIVAVVREVCSVPTATVSLVDAERQWFKAREGFAEPQTARKIAFCAHTILNEELFVIPDALADSRFADNPSVTGPPFIRAYAGAPLTSPDGYNLGALCAIDSRPRDFTPGQLSVLRHLATLVVEQLELRTLAHRDELTGALSRRAFVERARVEIERFGRYRRPASLIILDIDHFKTINDRFGHPAGDRVIAAVAATCRAELRPSDLFGRLGGEEFGLLLPETDGAEASRVGERLRQNIAALPAVTGAAPVTASFGIAAADTIGPPSWERWFEAADTALYAAKRAGRNQCRQSGLLRSVA